jgi:nucleotide-binding universal stress UspA family protein
MTLHSILAGVDGSPEATGAAATGWSLAQTAGAAFRLVHAARDPATVAPAMPAVADRERVDREVRRSALEALRPHLTSDLPPQAIERLEVRIGNPAWVLAQAVRDAEADLLVLGGKHHPAPLRWFGGSTVHHAVRTIDTPTLVTAGAPKRFERVLVAVDLSDAAGPAVAITRAVAALFEAELRVLHVIEPLPAIPDAGIELDEQEHMRLAGTAFDELVAKASGGSPLERVTRHGAPARGIADEVEAWGADLVVVGSHGKGWVDRVLLGSTTERLLNRLPCSVLVVPVRGPHPG